jgi:uncharacterized peroxidase-related enzyme
LQKKTDFQYLHFIVASQPSLITEDWQYLIENQGTMTMSRIDVLTEENAPAASRPMLAGVKQAFGMVPNVFKVLAHSPATLNTYLQFNQANDGSSLTAKQREIVGLAVSQYNGCEYCTAVHSMFGAKLGLSAEEIHSARDGSLDAYAVFARELTATRGQVSDSVIADARAAGLSDTAIVDIIAQVALLTLTNLLNNVAKTTLDFPPVKM